MSTNVFEIVPEEIERMAVDQFVDLVTTLMLDEGVRLKVPPNEIRVTRRIYDPDGGADAITDAGAEKGRYFAPGLTVWQFKKGWPDLTKLAGEVGKDFAAEIGTGPRHQKGEAVQEAFRQGAGYTLVVSDAMVPNIQQRRETQLEATVQAAGCTGPVRLLVADHIAAWASTVPAAMFDLRPWIREYLRADQVLARDPKHAIPFESDGVRQDTIIDVQTRLFGPRPATAYVRLQGLAGVGKSRLALEMVKALGLDRRTLYSPGVPSRDLFAWAAANDQVEGIVIVDECEDPQASQLEEWASWCGGRLRLLTVGPGGASSSPNVYVLGTLSPSTMERVIRSAAPFLDDRQVNWVAQKTQGYVKLAVVVADAIARGVTSMGAMPTDLELGRAVERMLIPSEEGRRALKGAALLTRVGFTGAVEDEGRAVADFMGVPWNQMPHLLAPAIDRGIVSQRGRYWYVSPELLALWLAMDVWRHEGHRIVPFHDGLPSLASREAFRERLIGIGDVPSVRAELERLLGASGPFPDLGSVDDAQAGRLFAAIANGAPVAALAALQRIIGPASQQELLRFEPGRREVVWVLERLLERRETFFGAARLLRRLAETENEQIANNATGAWCGIFLTMLASTEVPAPDRLVLLEEALESASAETRRLSIQGLAAALQGYEMAIPPSLSANVPPPYWRPRTWEEVRSTKRAALSLLGRALSDTAAAVRKEARSTVVAHARVLVQLGLGEDVVAMFQKLEGEDGAERRKIWEGIMGVLEFEREHLSNDQQRTLEVEAKRYYGDSLSDRVKRYLGPGALVNWPRDGESKDADLERISEGLAEEAFAAPHELTALLPWLTSDEAENMWPFASRIGQLDTDHRWLEPLREAATVGPNVRVLSGYLAGRAEAGDADEQEWREHLLDEWAKEPRLARIVFDATLTGAPSDRAAARLLHLVDEGWTEVRSLGWLQYGRWMGGISSRSLVELLRRLSQAAAPETIAAALAMVDHWLTIGKHTVADDFKELVWKLLGERVGWGHAPSMLAYYWQRIASQMIHEDPARIARMVVQMHIEGDLAYHDERLQLLEQAVRVAPRDAWKAIGRGLLSGTGAHRLWWGLEDVGLVARVPEDVVIDWIGEHGVAGAQAVAKALKPDGKSLPQVVRFLLQHHRDAVGRILAANFLSGSWSGSEVPYLAAKLGLAQGWQVDSEPSVRSWAADLVRSLEQQIEVAKVSEDEYAFA